MALHGALAGGLLAMAIYARLRRLDLLRWLDAAALGFPLGVAIARWGDYFNQQSFGVPTDLPWALSVDERYRPLLYLEQNGFHPTFLYESLWALVVFLGALAVVRRARVASGRPRWGCSLPIRSGASGLRRYAPIPSSWARDCGWP